MAWINGQWVDEQQSFGGMLGGLGAPGSMGDWNPPPLPPTPLNWTQDTPFMPGPQQPPIYDRRPQMQTPFGGGLGDITQWNPVQQPVQTPQFQPPQMYPPTPTPPRMPAPQVRPPMPPPPPTIGDVWPQVDSPPVGSTIIDLIDTGPQDTRTQQELNAADHAFNVAQRERTKVRLAEDRAKTKRHYAKLRAKGSSPQTIAKAKAKSKARGAKIKAQHPSRKSTIIYD